MTAPRFYDRLLEEHFLRNRQMAFVSGPRQVGKTTTCRQRAGAYVNWDNFNDRERVLAGPDKVAEALGLDQLRTQPPLVLFDELHKFARWTQFLKGIFNVYGERLRRAEPAGRGSEAGCRPASPRADESARGGALG